MTPQPQQQEYIIIRRDDWDAAKQVLYFHSPCIASDCERNSRPAPLTHIDSGDCLVICQHCGKVTQVQCKDAAQAREKVLDELCENIKEDFKEDFDGEMMINYQDFLWNIQSLRTGGNP